MADWNKKLEKKNNKELDGLINEYKDVYSDIQRALFNVMKKRNYRTNRLPEIEKEIKLRTNIRIAVQNIKVKTKASFKWTPEFKSEFETKLPEKIAIKTITRAIISMDWHVTHIENNIIEAKRSNDFEVPSEKIIVVFKNNKLLITSKSIKNNLCDFGKNNKRIEEFKLSYKKRESLYDEISLTDEIKEIEQKEEENKYVIPDELTKPERLKEKKIGYLIGGGILISLGLGGILALLSSLIYIISLYDIAIGLLTAIGLGYLIEVSNISKFRILMLIGCLSIGLTYFFSQLFRFMHIVNQNNLLDASLIDYFTAKLEQGIKYKEANFGMIGLIIAWIIEIFFALNSFIPKMAQTVLKHDLKKAPKDVLEFAVHCFNDGKNEEGVRKELYNKGWVEKEQQDLIINAVGARNSINALERR